MANVLTFTVTPSTGARSGQELRTVWAQGGQRGVHPDECRRCGPGDPIPPRGQACGTQGAGQLDLVLPQWDASLLNFGAFTLGHKELQAKVQALQTRSANGN